jgi:hypothetical protein
VEPFEFTSNGGGGEARGRGSPSPPSKKAQTDFLRGYQYLVTKDLLKNEAVLGQILTKKSF